MKDTIKYKKLQLQGDHVASGAFSQVFKARYNQFTVCVKRIRMKQANEAHSILREITLLRKSQHENVVKFIGHCEHDKTFYIVTEWIEGGNLRQYLKDYLIELSWQVRVDIAKGVAVGLQFMHDKGILHRDIKSRNILIERKKNRPKLCDFGFAAELTDADILTTTCGTGEWMAPELYNGAPTNSDKIDIFSYGIVLVELITRKNIARDLPRSSASNYGLDIELLKLHTPSDCPPTLLQLAISCCNIEPQLRTEWPQIIRTLDEISASLPSTDYCSDYEDDHINTGMTTDTNDGDDDGGDEEDDEEYHFVPRSPSISAPASPQQYVFHSPQQFYYQHVSTPQPSPNHSPTSSPYLSRPKKTAALRLLSHSRSGNTSDSGSSSGGSTRSRLSSVSAVNSNPHASSSPPSSPLGTPRIRQPPQSSISQLCLQQTHSSTAKTKTESPKRPPSTSASALELSTPAHEIAQASAPPQVATKTNYARYFLRKLAPARFIRSRSDPCITIANAAQPPDAYGPFLLTNPHVNTLARDTLRGTMLHSRKRGDTGERELPSYEHKDEFKLDAGEQKDGADFEGGDGSKEEDGADPSWNPDAEVAEVTNANKEDLRMNVREDYDPEPAKPLKVSKRKHKKPSINIYSVFLDEIYLILNSLENI